jgi:hypothetical protein
MLGESNPFKDSGAICLLMVEVGRFTDLHCTHQEEAGPLYLIVTAESRLACFSDIVNVRLCRLIIID